MSNQSKKTTLHPSENKKLSAIQNGHSSLLPKDLKILHFCVYNNKMLAVSHTEKTPGKRETFCFHVFDLTSGILQLNSPIFDPIFNRDVEFLDMCILNVEDWEGMAFAYTDNEPSLAEYYLIHFLRLEGEFKCYTLAFERSSWGPICSFDNTFLTYHSEWHQILMFDTSKWPPKEKKPSIDIELEFEIVVNDLITCSGKEPNKRVVMVEYLNDKGHGILCLDLKGDKLWEIPPPSGGVLHFDLEEEKLWEEHPSDACPMHHPRGDNKGHIFVIDHSCQTILVKNDESNPEVLLKLSGIIVNYHWSNIMNKLVVVHYNKKRDLLLVSCYDIVEK